MVLVVIGAFGAVIGGETLDISVQKSTEPGTAKILKLPGLLWKMQVWLRRKLDSIYNTNFSYILYLAYFTCNIKKRPKKSKWVVCE